MDTKSLKAGDRVYVGQHGSSYQRFVLATVVKVTPSGMVDVKFQPTSEYTTRFGADGLERGGDRWHCHYLDDKPFAERAALVAQGNRKIEASRKLAAIRIDDHTIHYCHEWSREQLMELVNKLERQLAEAKAAVEAI